MTRPPGVQPIAEYLIRRACRRLPGDAGGERYREWVAELPAILGDPDIRWRLLRSARALGYAAGVARSTRRLRRAGGRSRPPARRPAGPDGLPPARSGAPVVRVIAGVGIWLSVGALFVVLTSVFHPRGFWPPLAFLVAAVSFAAFCLADLARADEVRYLPKWGWAIACLLSIPLGGIMYLSAGRVRSS